MLSLFMNPFMKQYLRIIPRSRLVLYSNGSAELMKLKLNLITGLNCKGRQRFEPDENCRGGRQTDKETAKKLVSEER